MKKLKKQIIKYFLIVSFIIMVLQSMVDSLFDNYIFKTVNEDATKMQLVLVSYMVICIAIFVIFAFTFYKVVNKKIEEETRRQINEKSLLFANITHDLKTLITSILGFSKALKDNEADANQTEEIAGIIYEKSKRVDELINLLFYYSKLDTDAYTLNKQEQDICVLVRELVAEAYDEFEKRQINLEIDIPEEPILCTLTQLNLEEPLII